MKQKSVVVPTVEQLEKELKRERNRNAYRKAMRSTIDALLVVIAAAVLVSMLALPVIRVVGDGMSPALDSGQIVVATKYTDFSRGDVIAFYYNNKILIKRVIALSGDWVNIDGEGTVFVNGNRIDEPYVREDRVGECDIELPYKVPKGKIFVMGDQRQVSTDSRNMAVGCVAQEQIVGRVRLRVWPMDRIGLIR